MALLAQGLGASLSILYLTTELVEAHVTEAKLVPVVIFPETAAIIGADTNEDDLNTFSSLVRNNATDSSTIDSTKNVNAIFLPNIDNIDNQLVLPLVHENMMLGVLVTTCTLGRMWNEQERGEIKRVVQTLAIACILDQKRAWLHSQLHSSQIIQEKQQDLLDSLLHQFRNPLTALRTFGKLLMKRLQPGDKNREVATSIVRESDRLQELLQKFDEVIDLRASEFAPLLQSNKQLQASAPSSNSPRRALLLPGSDELETDCDVKDILLPLLDSANAIAAERGLQLISNIPSQLPLLRASSKALREVFSNIIDNALKYTPSGGKVLVEAGLFKGNMQGVEISDTGPGIPQQDLEHLGERHYRGVQAQTDIPGTGLGISIAQQLIEQMQGEIQVISPAINSVIKSSDIVGTTFIVWLPVAS
ncbi:sensor histidine kinase [Dulcicalothrix desertica PCC 7102]|uniref:histidine kinase n=2 Tax=Dulcicalothrix desertica TaxID=32056 RepID=A0A3S1AKL3_9CYAN|nr:sensor histidine kinase [Dulcicalothrix desertica PCC 7102]TWH53555.1 phospho-acceptor domain-containing protein [Dulcicalothrix desertica PCC 7102]